MKYFIKYREWKSKDTYINKTRFFNTDNIEEEWNAFKSFCTNPVALDDISPLPDQQEHKE